MRIKRGGAGLLIVQTHAERGEGDRPGESLAREPEERHFAGLGRWLDDDGGELGEQAHRLGQLAQRSFGFFVALVDRRGGFELEGLGRGGALALQRRKQTCAMGAERFEDSVCFGAMAIRRAGLIAGRQALLHFEVGTGGMLGIWVQVFDAAAQLEEVEHGVAGALGSGARGEWAEAAIRSAADIAIGCEETREVVLQSHAQICGRRSRSRLRTALASFADESVDDLPIEQQRGFQLRSVG